MAPWSRLTPELLLHGYANGLFPMAESADDPDVYWVEPKLRGVFPLDGIVVSRSLRKAVTADRLDIRIDRDFNAVIAGCAEVAADRPTTWINATIRDSYAALFDRGLVHTVEAYRDGRLVGGLYGVALAGAFFGESMFHRETDASKIALVHLAARLILGGYKLLDAQFVTPHLARLGAVEMRQAAYRRLLSDALKQRAQFPDDDTRLSGADALDMVLSHQRQTSDNRS